MPKPVIFLVCFSLFAAPVAWAFVNSSNGGFASIGGATSSVSDAQPTQEDEKADEKSDMPEKALIYFYDDG